MKTQNTLLAPYVLTGTSSGLKVLPDRTLALVGGDIIIEGGVVTGGRIELASLGKNASVGITQMSSSIGSSIMLSDVLGDRNDVRISNKSLLDVNGINSGSIQIQGRQVDLTSGSILWIQNQATGGNVIVNASDRILADGTAPDLVTITADRPVFNTVSGIVNETLGGDSGSIILTAPSITVQNGASILSRSFSSGVGGDVKLNANTVTVSGASSIFSDIFSVIGSSAAANGKGGKVDLDVRNLSLLNGGIVTALTTGTGNSGDIMVNADTILISGLSPIAFASSMSAPSLGGKGMAGNILINTRKLSILAGGALSSVSFGPGKGGDITVNASESIDVIGFKQQEGNNYQTGISASVAPPLDPYKSLFSLRSDNATGDSGDVVIKTRSLKVLNQGFIVVENTGLGAAGILDLKADRLEIANVGFISASSQVGQGGNIIIHATLLLLRNSGDIRTSSINNNGGNINIISNMIVGLGDSDIIASSISGTGGSIKITAQELFGLKFRDRLTIGNDITASSESGSTGTVQINAITIDPSAVLNALPTAFHNATQMISNRCDTDLRNRFIITGRGGLPKNPSERFQIYRGWGDVRSPARPNVPVKAINPNAPILEASRFDRHPDGSIELVANGSIMNPPIVATCNRE